MKHAVKLFLALFAAMGAVECGSASTAVQRVTATTAQLVLKGQPDCNVDNIRFFEYAASKAALETDAGRKTGEAHFGPGTPYCGEDPIGHGSGVTGLTPDTTYYYRQCERNESSPEDTCGAIGQFTTREPAAAMQRIVARDGDLFRNGERFRVLGVQNLDHDFERSFYTNGSAEYRTGMTSRIKAARTMGANTMRIHLQLFDFIGRHRHGELFAHQNAYDNLAFLQTIAEHEGLYLLVSGNNVWRPDDAPAWYDDMPYRDRWEVQAFFFEHLAATGATSPAILGYELMSEPVLRTGEDADWYSGEYGGYWFVQAIAKGVPREQGKQVARDWIKRLTSAIRNHDANGLVTFGAMGKFHGGALGIDNTAPLLDIVSPHIYPQLDRPEHALQAAQRFAGSGKPVVVGETHLYTANTEIYRDFLLRSIPYVDGHISFFNGTGPDDMEIDRESPEAFVLEIHKANLQQLQDLRDVLLNK